MTATTLYLLYLLNLGLSALAVKARRPHWLPITVGLAAWFGVQAVMAP